MLCEVQSYSGTLRMIHLFPCALKRTAVDDDHPEKDHERVNFNIHQPTYSVIYLGCETLYKPGLSEMCDAVGMIYYQKKYKLKSLGHYSLTLSKQELSLRDQDSTEDEERVFGMRRILFCGVYKPKPTIFFYNYQFGPKGEQVDCHVLLCKNKREAKSLAEVIRKAFREAQHDAHIQEVANRKLHARGLTESLNSLSGESSLSSNMDTNRQFYTSMNFSREKVGCCSDDSFQERTSKPRAASQGDLNNIHEKRAFQSASLRDVNGVHRRKGCQGSDVEETHAASTKALLSRKKQKHEESGTRPSNNRADLVELSTATSWQDNGINTWL